MLQTTRLNQKTLENYEKNCKNDKQQCCQVIERWKSRLSSLFLAVRTKRTLAILCSILFLPFHLEFLARLQQGKPAAMLLYLSVGSFALDNGTKQKAFSLFSEFAPPE